MYSRKFGDGELRITMEDSLKQEVAKRGINPVEIYRLIDNFANDMLASKTNDVISLTNEDTGASLDLEFNWESDKDVVVKVIAVNLNNLKATPPPPRSKVNLGPPIEN